jgi:hypothetical protein
LGQSSLNEQTIEFNAWGEIFRNTGITIGDDFLGFCDENISVSICPIPRVYGTIGVL